MQSYRLTREHIEPLNVYEIKVWPSDCEAAVSSVTVYIDWYCQFPGCKRSRRKREEKSYSAFCSPKHAARFGASYCLYPECTEKASHGNFCSESHLEKAKGEGVCGLVNASGQYEKLKNKFSKSWCSKKGNVPKISHVLEIVNPKLQQRLDNYVLKLSWPHNGVEQYYHGTQIKCDMLEYYEPCSKSNCGVCGISKKGFDPQRINSTSWQRFGKGFYFARNSSKSYDYPRATQDATDNVTNKYHCMLVCDIAPGCKYTLYKNEPSIRGPPKGYHSIYGSSQWLWGLWKSPDMNYDELVVFDIEAIRPHYILFLESNS
jgi:hypothetical protein